MDTKGSFSNILSASSMSSISSRRPSRKSNSSAHRRELVWRPQKNETVSLGEIALQFKRFLLTFSTELGFNRRRGRYTTKTAHRCPGYNRVEITLTPEIAQSAIVSHLTPNPHEICPVCKEIVKDAEIISCICGRDGKSAPARSFFVLTSLPDNEFIPTIRCSSCSEWHHRPCVSISENEDQSFVCQSCKPEVQTEPKTNKSQPPEQVRPWISATTTSTTTAPDTVDEPEILRSPPTRPQLPSIDGPSQPSDIRWDRSLGKSNGSIQSVEPRSLQTEGYDQTENASSSTTSSSGIDFEPDNKWKEDLRKRIEEGFRPMVADLKDNHATELSNAPDTTEARIRLEADYKETMNKIRSLTNEQYIYELDRERNQRRWTAGVPMTPDWPQYFRRDQQNIVRSTGSGATILPSTTEQMQLETQNFVEDFKKMEEEAIRKDMEMKKREDILRRREQQLMLRVADNLRREEEAKKKLEEEARRREESKEKVRKVEEAKQEARPVEETRKGEARQEEGIRGKAGQAADMVEREASRKGEEARLINEREEAGKKLAEAKREEDNMKRKLDADSEERRKADETTRRREEDSRRREEARLEEFRCEQEDTHRGQTPTSLVQPKPGWVSQQSLHKIVRSTSEEKAEAHEKWISPGSPESDYNQSSRLKSSRMASYSIPSPGRYTKSVLRRRSLVKYIH